MKADNMLTLSGKKGTGNALLTSSFRKTQCSPKFLLLRVWTGRLKARFGFSHFILVQSFIEFLTAFLSDSSLHSILNFMISIFLSSFLASPLLLFSVPQNLKRPSPGRQPRVGSRGAGWGGAQAKGASQGGSKASTEKIATVKLESCKSNQDFSSLLAENLPCGLDVREQGQTGHQAEGQQVREEGVSSGRGACGRALRLRPRVGSEAVIPHLGS